MNDEKDRSKLKGEAITEAERMARIRELLVGPVMADESARVDQQFTGLDQTLGQQRQAIAELGERLERLERSQRQEFDRLRLRLLGLVEALLADHEEIEARLERSETLRQRLTGGDGNDGV